MNYMWALYAREVKRFSKLFIETFFSPLIQMFLFLTVFGVAMQGQAVDGYPYQTFVYSGLLMMIMINSSFMSPTFSLVLSKNVGTIIDLQLAPIKPGNIGLAYALAAFTRGVIASSVAFIASVWFISGFHIAHPFVMILSLILTGIEFGLLGVLLGMKAKSFEMLQMIMTFALQPMIFLAGIFYPLTNLPPVFGVLSRFNPMHHNINLFRSATIGYADTNPYFSLIIIALMTVLLFFIVQYVTKKELKKSF